MPELEVLSQDEYHEERLKERQDELLMSPAFEAVMKRLPQTIRKADVIDGFTHAFELIGGIPRLAIWADEHPSEFYKLYGKLIPSTIKADVNTRVKVVHTSLPPNPQDVENG